MQPQLDGTCHWCLNWYRIWNNSNCLHLLIMTTGERKSSEESVHRTKVSKWVSSSEERRKNVILFLSILYSPVVHFHRLFNLVVCFSICPISLASHLIRVSLWPSVVKSRAHCTQVSGSDTLQVGYSGNNLQLKCILGRVMKSRAVCFSTARRMLCVWLFLPSKMSDGACNCKVTPPQLVAWPCCYHSATSRART